VAIFLTHRAVLKADAAAANLGDDSTMNVVTGYEAAWDCNWLSEQEGTGEAQ
jgi:hypothetical protein